MFNGFQTEIPCIVYVDGYTYLALRTFELNDKVLSWSNCTCYGIKGQNSTLIYQKYIDENMGMKAIADYLNRNGIKKQRPKNKQDYKFDDWSDHTIKAILDNPVYTGYIAFGRRRTVKCINEEGEIVDKLLKQEDYITSDEQSHEALVSKELWDKAQQKRKSRAVRGNKRIGQAPKHLLSGILKCITMCISVLLDISIVLM